MSERSGDLGVGVIREWIRLESEPPIFDPTLPPLAAGDVVEVDPLYVSPGRPFRPVRRRLEGKGPWMISVDPSETSIRVVPTDEVGTTIDAMLVIDGRAFETHGLAGNDATADPFVFEVNGLDLGPHRVALAVKNRLTHLYRVVLTEGERRTISGRLLPRNSVAAPKPK